MQIRTILPSASVLGGLALFFAACSPPDVTSPQDSEGPPAAEDPEGAELSLADLPETDIAGEETLMAAEAAPHDDEHHHDQGDEPVHNHDHGSSDAGHADHDHDHDHGEHAGGAPHVHGVAQLALSREGNRISGEMMSPLANFGLSEAEGVITDAVRSGIPGLVSLSGGNCVSDMAQAEVDRTSGHADAKIGYSWRCADATAVTAVRFLGFVAYPGFETIETVFLDETGQKAGRLTPSSPELALK